MTVEEEEQKKQGGQGEGEGEEKEAEDTMEDSVEIRLFKLMPQVCKTIKAITESNRGFKASRLLSELEAKEHLSIEMRDLKRILNELVKSGILIESIDDGRKRNEEGAITYIVAKPSDLPSVTAKTKVKIVPIEQLEHGSNLLRKYIDEDIMPLAISIQNEGIVTPLLVREESSKLYIVIDGNRRLAAAQIAGLKQIPCLVLCRKDFYNLSGWATKSSDLEFSSLLANVHRRELSDFELSVVVFELTRKFSHARVQHALGLNYEKFHQLLEVFSGASDGGWNQLLIDALKKKLISVKEGHKLNKKLKQGLITHDDLYRLLVLKEKHNLTQAQVEKAEQALRTNPAAQDSELLKKTEEKIFGLGHIFPEGKVVANKAFPTFSCNCGTFYKLKPTLDAVLILNEKKKEQEEEEEEESKDKDKEEKDMPSFLSPSSSKIPPAPHPEVEVEEVVFPVQIDSIIVNKLRCSFCGQVYKTEEEARKCEKNDESLSHIFSSPSRYS
jgi:ParB/RepB/Spo0J family partition protein